MSAWFSLQTVPFIAISFNSIRSTWRTADGWRTAGTVVCSGCKCIRIYFRWPGGSPASSRELKEVHTGDGQLHKPRRLDRGVYVSHTHTYTHPPGDKAEEIKKTISFVFVECSTRSTRTFVANAILLWHFMRAFRALRTLRRALPNEFVRLTREWKFIHLPLRTMVCHTD